MSDPTFAKANFNLNDCHENVILCSGITPG
jgi:hypothetical protein